MTLLLDVVDQAPLPRVAWRWEPETDILAGALRPAPEGAPATLELSGHDGSVVVADLAGGVLAGVDVVVWPEVLTTPGLAPPVPVRVGAVRIQLASRATAIEAEVAMAARATPAEDLIHLRVGATRPSTAVQVADHLVIEVDTAGGLAGLWLSAVPPLTEGD